MDSHLCPWNQTLPFVIRAAPQLEPRSAKYPAPTVHFRFGRKHVEKELAEFARTPGNQIARANDRRGDWRPMPRRKPLPTRCRKPGRRRWRACEKRGEPALVLVGRPYNLYDRSVNCDIPRKLRTLYGVNVLPMDFLPLDAEDISRRQPQHVLELRAAHSGRGAH